MRPASSGCSNQLAGVRVLTIFKEKFIELGEGCRSLRRGLCSRELFTTLVRACAGSFTEEPVGNCRLRQALNGLSQLDKRLQARGNFVVHTQYGESAHALLRPGAGIRRLKSTPRLARSDAR